MGQKVHPHGFRLGYIYDWNSKWYADRNYTELLHEDLAIRGAIKKMLPDAGIARVEIERNANQMTVIDPHRAARHRHRPRRPARRRAAHLAREASPAARCA